MTDQPTDLRDRIVAAMRRAPFEDLRPDWTAPNGPLKITARINDLADAVLAELRTVPAVPVSSPPPDQTAEPVCMCGHPMRQHHEDVCLTECGCHDGREPETAGDLSDRLEAALTARFTELGNPFSRMRIAFQGPDGWPASKGVSPHDVALVLRELLAAAPAVLPPPADRTAFLQWAADFAAAFNSDCQSCAVELEVANGLRRLAAEAQQPDTAHSCSNCEGVDPDSCPMNPNRPDVPPSPAHIGGNADDCPACQAQGLHTIGHPYECPGPETTASGEEAGRG